MATPAAAAQSDAEAVVESLHAGLLDIMREAESLGFEGRRDRIAPVIKRGYDLGFVARLTIARHWSQLEPEQRAEMVDAFTRLTIATYAARFNGYAGETFETVSTETARKGRMLVRTLLKVSGAGEEDVRLDYLLHEVGGEWRIINVVANGVSDLSLKRADYDVTLKQEGFDALVAKLNAQISQYEHSQ